MLDYDFRYDELLDEYLDEAYEQIAAKREAHSKQRKRAKQNYSKGDPLLEVSIFS